MEMQNDSGVDGQAVALISKIRHLSIYSIIYGAVLIPILLLWEGDYHEIIWPACGIFILGGVWAYFFPSKASLLISGIIHSLAFLYGAVFGLYGFMAGIVFAIVFFMRFRDICRIPVTREDLAHVRSLRKQFRSHKPVNVIRIIVITLVDKRIWKCAIGEDQLLIHSQLRDEMHVGRREDVRILGSNANKPRIHVKFTLRMNGEIYRCKTSRPAYRKLVRWIESGRWEMTNQQS